MTTARSAESRKPAGDLIGRCAIHLAVAGDSELDSAIRAVLAEVTRAYQADRACVAVVVADQTQLAFTHEYCVDAVQPLQDIHYRGEEFPWGWERLMAGETVFAPTTRAIRPDGGHLADIMEEEGIHAIYLAPILEGGRATAVVDVEWIRKPLPRGSTSCDGLDDIVALLGSALVRKRGNERRLALEGELRKLQKRELVGQLAAGITHDFNNILMVIFGESELGSEALAEGDERAASESLEAIVEAAQRAAGLTGQLLTFTGSRASRRTALRADRHLHDMGQLLTRLMPDHVTMSMDIAGDVPPVWIAPTELEQVVMNLCVNARDAMPQGGALTVTLAITTPDEVRLRVRDTGVGMTEAQRLQALDPFFTTKAETGGTGLGLAVVGNIIEACGGRLELTSAPAGGTTVDLFLPAAHGLAALRPTEVSVEALGGSERILLAEDDPFVRKLATRILGRAGYRVVAVSDGVQALAAYEREAERFDLLVLDALMPHAGGGTVASAARLSQPELPILFATGYAGDTLPSTLLEAARTAVILKPYTSKALLRQLRELLDADRTDRDGATL